VKGLLVFGAMVEVVSAEILVEGSRLEHMVGGGEQGGGSLIFAPVPCSWLARTSMLSQFVRISGFRRRQRFLQRWRKQLTSGLRVYL
jgi:hypothetical protein